MFTGRRYLVSSEGEVEHCNLFHKWSRWYDTPLIRQILWFAPEVIMGQHRYCLRCNKKELRDP